MTRLVPFSRFYNFHIWKTLFPRFFLLHRYPNPALPQFLTSHKKMKSKMRSRKLTSSMPSYYTYLKPGALAQIRNSKITARSRVLSDPQNLIQQTPSSEIQVSLPAPAMENIPSFNLKIKNNRPCCLQRKKLTAVAPIFCEPNHDPALVTI